MKLDMFLIGVIVVGLFATGFGYLITDMSTTYNVPVDERISTVYGNYNLSDKIAESAVDDIKDASITGTGNDFDITQALKQSVSILKNVFIDGIPAALMMVTSIGNFLPFPPFIIHAIQASIIVSVAFALVYLFLRYKNE